VRERRVVTTRALTGIVGIWRCCACCTNAIGGPWPSVERTLACARVHTRTHHHPSSSAHHARLTRTTCAGTRMLPPPRALPTTKFNRHCAAPHPTDTRACTHTHTHTLTHDASASAPLSFRQPRHVRAARARGATPRSHGTPPATHTGNRAYDVQDASSFADVSPRRCRHTAATAISATAAARTAIGDRVTVSRHPWSRP